MSTLPDFIPVPRRRADVGWTPARQWAFLQALETMACVRDAALSVGMSEASAYRLRRHPEAEDFRRAWAAAQGRIWQRVEQVALERVVHGDIEVIERDGEVVATRRRPCSDRLMIHMLQAQVKRLEAEALALAAARDAADRVAKWRADAAVPAPPRDVAAAETAALRAMHAQIDALPDSTGWDAHALMLVDDYDGPSPRLPMPEKTLAPANIRAALLGKVARVRTGDAIPGVRKTALSPDPRMGFSPPGSASPGAG